MIQEILSTKKWGDMMAADDLRALTPLINKHINPYGKLNSIWKKGFHLFYELGARCPLVTVTLPLGRLQEQALKIRI